MTIEASSSVTGSFAPLELCGNYFRGFALFPHLRTIAAPSGHSHTVRTPFAEKLYQTLFNGSTSFMEEIADTYVEGIESLFAALRFDYLLFVPPPTTRRDYSGAIRLTGSISMKTGIHSLQHAVRQVPEHPRTERGIFAFASETVSEICRGKNLLVLADFYRSGRSLHALTAFLAQKGGAGSISVLAGTVVQRELS